MEHQPIPLDVCKVKEKNETILEQSFYALHQKLLNVQKESASLRVDVKKLDHENALLEKEEYCLDSKNKILEEEISSLKAQTEEVACSVENLKWKMFKIKQIKEFEQKSNESTYSEIREKKEKLNQALTKSMETEEPEDMEVKKQAVILETKEKIAKLREEIEMRKKNIQMTDPKLFTNMKMLEKRNAALLLRYQRQLGEATSRYRQTQYEVDALKKILADTNSLIMKSYASTSKK